MPLTAPSRGVEEVLQHHTQHLYNMLLSTENYIVWIMLANTVDEVEVYEDHSVLL